MQRAQCLISSLEGLKDVWNLTLKGLLEGKQKRYPDSHHRWFSSYDVTGNPREYE